MSAIGTEQTFPSLQAKSGEPSISEKAAFSSACGCGTDTGCFGYEVSSLPEADIAS